MASEGGHGLLADAYIELNATGRQPSSMMWPVGRIFWWLMMMLGWDETLILGAKPSPRLRNLWALLCRLWLWLKSNKITRHLWCLYSYFKMLIALVVFRLVAVPSSTLEWVFKTIIWGLLWENIRDYNAGCLCIKHQANCCRVEVWLEWVSVLCGLTGQIWIKVSRGCSNMFRQRGSSITPPLPHWSDTPPQGDEQYLYEGFAKQHRIDSAVWMSVLG